MLERDGIVAARIPHDAEQKWPGTAARLAKRLEIGETHVARMRTAIEFWAMARYPEISPAPTDMEGRQNAQAALEIAENTLYQIAKAKTQDEKQDKD